MAVFVSLCRGVAVRQDQQIQITRRLVELTFALLIGHSTDSPGAHTVRPAPPVPSLVAESKMPQSTLVYAIGLWAAAMLTLVGGWSRRGPCNCQIPTAWKLCMPLRSTVLREGSPAAVGPALLSVPQFRGRRAKGWGCCSTLGHAGRAEIAAVAIVPGKPAESLLVAAIRYESLEMPPKSKLAPEQVAVLVRWIEIWCVLAWWRHRRSH